MDSHALSAARVIVTGAARGIGAATARALVRRGARVLMTGRDAGALGALAAELEAAGGTVAVHVADLTGERAAGDLVAAALARLGGLDALVNNAGIIEPVARLADSDPQAWDRNLAINLGAPVRLTRAALEPLRASRGRVVNVSSGAAVGPVPGWSAYCVAKAGLNQLTRMLAVEEPDVVSVAFSPGMTDTDMQAAIRRDGPAGMPAAVLGRFVGAHERGALRPPESVGEAVAALALHAPAAMSGEFVSIDDEAVAALVGAG